MRAPTHLQAEEHPEGNFLYDILSHELFRQHYLDGVVRVDHLMRTNAVYAREGTRAFEERTEWTEPVMSDEVRSAPLLPNW